jgi:hypothetical protein
MLIKGYIANAQMKKALNVPNTALRIQVLVIIQN